MKVIDVLTRIAIAAGLFLIAVKIPDTASLRGEIAILSSAVRELQIEQSETSKSLDGIDSSLCQMAESAVSRNEKLKSIAFSLDQIDAGGLKITR